jgi:hypothetical protein
MSVIFWCTLIFYILVFLYFLYFGVPLFEAISQQIAKGAAGFVMSVCPHGKALLLLDGMS